MTTVTRGSHSARRIERGRTRATSATSSGYPTYAYARRAAPAQKKTCMSVRVVIVAQSPRPAAARGKAAAFKSAPTESEVAPEVSCADACERGEREKAVTPSAS